MQGRTKWFGMALLVATGSLGLVAGCEKHKDDAARHRHGGEAETRREGRAAERTLEGQDAAAKLPAAVREGLNRQFRGATVQNAQKETYRDGTVHWEVEFTTPDGKKMEKEFDSAGRLLPDDH